MIKDTFFSMSRFLDLCRKDMVESWKTNLLRITMLFGLMAVIFIWRGCYVYSSERFYSHTVDQMVPSSLTIGFWIFAIAGCISASFTMEKMKTKTNRLSILLLPATSFEKYFSRWLISTIIYIIAFAIAFKLADYSRVLICKLIFPDALVSVTGLKHLFTSNDYYIIDFKEWGVGAFMIYFFFQSCFILGSSIWPKNSLIKTFIAGFLMLLAYGFMGAGLMKLFGGVSHIQIPDHAIAEGTLVCVLKSVIVVFTLMNWTLGYFRFKEAEIINRM